MESLPVETLKHIFGYTGDPRALLSCERSCTRFKAALEDDHVWKHSCVEYEAHTDGTVGESYRERAFIGKILGEIKADQRSSPARREEENVILSVLPPTRIGGMINDYIVTLFNHDAPRSNMRFDVRGDALRCLLDIVEAHMVAKFELASLISSRASHGNGDYPAVVMYDIQIIERSQGTHYTQQINGDRNTRGLLDRAIHSELDDLDERTCYQLARRLATRAGVVKMTSEVMREAVTDIFMIMANLLWRPMLIHRDILKHSTATFDIDSIDLWHDIPPAIGFTEDGITGHRCVIVPSQIEESATKLALNVGFNAWAHGSEGQFKVYGRHIWALSDGQTLDVAIQTAKNRYMIPQKENYDEELSSSDEYDSLSETSSDSDFSEYDDDECPDAAPGGKEQCYWGENDAMDVDIENL